MKKIVGVVVLLSGLVACSRDADVVSRNLSYAADKFEISRRIVFYNGITGEYMLEIRGLCSLGNYDRNKELSVTCKTGPGTYKKNFLGLSNNVTYFAEQIDAQTASASRYSVTFKPSAIVPEIEMR